MLTHTGELPTFATPAGTARYAVRSRHLLIGTVALVGTVATMLGTRLREADPSRAPAQPDATEIIASLGRRASHGHHYQAEVVGRTPLATGVRQSWTVRLTRRGHRRVSGARLTVRSWSPETGEISTTAPQARYVGGGRYRIDDIVFPHPGWWNVALVVDAASGTDSVAFNVVMPTTRETRARAHHRHLAPHASPRRRADGTAYMPPGAIHVQPHLTHVRRPRAPRHQPEPKRRT